MASSELPPHVAFEILTRTSLETLDACKVVSKTWNGMTYESSFMQSYCRRTNNFSGYVVQGIIRNKYTSQFVSMEECPLLHVPVENLKTNDSFNCDMKIEASSKQGILCCIRPTRNKNYRYYVCKPSTQQWKVLPNPKLRYPTVKVALVVLKSNPLHFKIIRLSEDQPPYSSHLGADNYSCEIFDSETNAWRQVNIISLSEHIHFEVRCLPVNASGLIYLLTSNSQVIVLNYDGQEAFPRFKLPEQVNDYEYRKLISYEGKLGLICLSPSEVLEVWCIENTINHCWRKEKEVDIERVKTVMNYPIPIDFYSNDVFLTLGFNVLVFCKQTDENLHAVRLDNLDTPTQIFPFRSDRLPANWSFGIKT